jgi:predicted cupin superfamily sugar epimerase
MTSSLITPDLTAAIAGDLTAAQIRERLRLDPHPEGGCYRETWREPPAEGADRGAVTSILFLLAAGERSAWHRIDATELWLWHAGATLELHTSQAGRVVVRRLGPGLASGESFQGVVPAQVWQSAHTTGAWSLVSCVVAPAFSFEGFELAPPAFQG